MSLHPFIGRKRELAFLVDLQEKMIQMRFGTCYLFEIKFLNRKIHPEILHEVKLKIRNLARPKNISIRPVLIHVNGVDESVEESNFFSSILDFNRLL